MKYKIFTLVILSLVIFTANYQISAQSVEVLIKTAEAAIDKRDFENATKIPSGVLAKQPNNSDARTQNARLLYFQGKMNEAVAEADKAIAANPNNSTAYNLRGIAKKDLGKDLAGALDAKNPKALINRGMMYWNQNRFDDALADMNRAVELAPASDSFYYIRGGFYHFRKDYAKAIEDYTKAIELAPENGNYYGNRAETAQFLEFRKQFGEIITEYKNFLARYENVTLSDGRQVPVTNLKEILSRFTKHLERVNVQLKFAGL